MAETRCPSIRAIDLMYFPPAPPSPTVVQLEQHCHEAIRPVAEAAVEAGVEKVFVTQCKRLSCDRRYLCDDAQLDDVLRYTFPYPQQFIGIAGFNPMNIAASIHEAELGIAQHGFAGVYIHPGSFGVSLNDRRMYPLYLKAQEWGVPVILDVRQLPADVCDITAGSMLHVAEDFPGVMFVVAQSQWAAEELTRLVTECDNVYFCFDTASLLHSELRRFLSSETGRERSLWGSNGLPWKQCLQEIDRIGFDLPVREKLLRGNAVRLFRLNERPVREPQPFQPSESAFERVAAE